MPLDDFREPPQVAEGISKEAWESIPHCPACEERVLWKSMSRVVGVCLHEHFSLENLTFSTRPCPLAYFTINQHLALPQAIEKQVVKQGTHTWLLGSS